jgi:hypothetical protein
VLNGPVICEPSCTIVSQSVELASDVHERGCTCLSASTIHVSVSIQAKIQSSPLPSMSPRMACEVAEGISRPEGFRLFITRKVLYALMSLHARLRRSILWTHHFHAKESLGQHTSLTTNSRHFCFDICHAAPSLTARHEKPVVDPQSNLLTDLLCPSPFGNRSDTHSTEPNARTSHVRMSTEFR